MSDFSDTAMVLAAGRGERLRPITDTIPKPMVEVAGHTMLDRQLDLLARAGIKRAVVNTAWLAEKIEAHLATRRTPEIIFSREEKALETGGGIAMALSYFGEKPFFSLNSDVILCEDATSPLARMRDVWDGTKMDALLLLVKREDTSGYSGTGDFFLEPDATLTRKGVHAEAPYVFTGVQLLAPHLFDDCPSGAFSMNILYDRNPARVCGIVHDAKWLHVGDPQGLADANAILAAAS